MTNEDKKIVNTAYFMVRAVLTYKEPNAKAISELYEIHTGNKKVFLEHLKAINSITGKAIKILEGKDTWNNQVQ